MSIAEWLIQTMVALRDAGVDSPRRDSLVLLEDVLQKDRAWVLAHPEHTIEPGDLKRVNKLIERRISREPLAYIRGRAWFYRRFFVVNKNVLIPRPESENFIDLLRNIRTKKIIDIGTGSGALAITAALEFPGVTVIATDTSSEALELAQQNAASHEVKIKFLLGSLLEPLHEADTEHTAVIANLPYVPAGMVTSPEVQAEPTSALFSGPDGLDHYRMFWNEISLLKNKPDQILTESLESQHETIQKHAHDAGFRLSGTSLLIQQFEKLS